MNLSISNIAWSEEYDNEMYNFLDLNGITGIEIAPTRIFPKNPYDTLKEANNYAKTLKEKYGLTICSMQSIWFGCTQKIFESIAEREFLIDYTKRAVLFAEEIRCPNLVFGCPKNRVMPDNCDLSVAYDFFRIIGDFAHKHHTVIAIEPNPPIYNTNFINTTEEAFDFCKRVNSKGIMVNVDLGTCIYYGESIELLYKYLNMINHIHISEPMLAPIKKRQLHNDLRKLDYNKFFSIEMSNQHDADLVKEKIRYIKEVFS